MPNELYRQMQGRQGNPMEQNFMNFMNQFRGQNPRQIIDNLVSSGKLTQQQLNAVLSPIDGVSQNEECVRIGKVCLAQQRAQSLRGDPVQV